MTTPIAFDYLATQPATPICGQLLGHSAYYLVVEVDGIPRSYRRDLVAGLDDIDPFVCTLPLPGNNKPLVELWLKGFSDQDKAAYIEQINQAGYPVYTAKPKGAYFAPGFLLRSSQAVNLTYAICADTSWRTKTVRDMQLDGVIVHGPEAFLAFLRDGTLAATEPAWPPSRVTVAPPQLDSDGHLKGWAFKLGSWAFGALCWMRVNEPVDESDAFTGWARPEVPQYAFAEHTIVHSATGGFSFQIESAVAGYFGWVLVKHYIGNRLQGRLRCRQFEFVQTLQDGDMSRLQPLVSE